MVSQTGSEKTPEEHLIFWTIGLTYVFYALGALYVVAPVIGWCLLLLVCWRFASADERFTAPGIGVWVWWIATLAILVALIIGHFDYGLSRSQLIKSIIGWAKGWAMFPVFVTVGACLSIRLQVLARAANIVSVQTLVLAPLLVAAAYIGIPPEIWVSPLSAVGGPGPEFFAFRLYGVSPDGSFRWAFFAPWAPGAGMAAVTLLALGIMDTDRRWVFVGVLGVLAMAILVKSRLALLGLPIAVGAGYTLCNMRLPLLHFCGAVCVLAVGLLWGPLVEALLEAREAFENYRSNSTEVRSTLQAIAGYRYSEAPVWGHGIQDSGTHIVAFMPIGSHHTWYGLLFVKGMVGVVAFAVPMVLSLGLLIVRGQVSHAAMAGLMVLTGMWIYSFGENLEVLAYLFWIGLVVMGLGMQRNEKDPALAGGVVHTNRSHHQAATSNSSVTAS